ncbi:unnamed protein product [Anisakis simplex]|uniref:Phorbol-ester/DAG-type domain-containing protein n=1 Tax=Anisakis simplex TaxID=6269 RepID=A0A0M3JZY2_ANISI|nr:unnamed protein product [Anisakis simplex]
MNILIIFLSLPIFVCGINTIRPIHNLPNARAHRYMAALGTTSDTRFVTLMPPLSKSAQLLLTQHHQNRINRHAKLQRAVSAPKMDSDAVIHAIATPHDQSLASLRVDGHSDGIIRVKASGVTQSKNFILPEAIFDSLDEPLDHRTDSRLIDNDAYLNSNSIQDELFVRKQVQRTTLQVHKYSTTTPIPNAHSHNVTKISTAPSNTTSNDNDNIISNSTVNKYYTGDNNNNINDEDQNNNSDAITIPPSNTLTSKPPPRALSSRVLPTRITPNDFPSSTQAPLLPHLVSTRFQIPSVSESSKFAASASSMFRMPNQIASSLPQTPHSIAKPTHLNKSPSFETTPPKSSSNSTIRRPSSALRSTAVVPYGAVPSEMSPWIALPVLVNTTAAQQIGLIVYPSQKASFAANNNIPASPSFSAQQSSINNIPFTNNLRTVNSTMATPSPTDDTLGCSWDFITNSCKDIFNVNWCTQCHDFGNVFVHNCKCIVRNATPPKPTFLT